MTNDSILLLLKNTRKFPPFLVSFTNPSSIGSCATSHIVHCVLYLASVLCLAFAPIATTIVASTLVVYIV
jgi:hypothetical protein